MGTILLFEGSVPATADERVYIPAVSFMRPEANTNAFRHSGKMSVCFGDGHIKLTGIRDLRKGSPLWEMEKPLE
ncbi:MAG: hypothetical protein HPY69_03850 [Armatimonadetes bacterium]|nr:hypothetical protein [Armatimonadota bacterium]